MHKTAHDEPQFSHMRNSLKRTGVTFSILSNRKFLGLCILIALTCGALVRLPFFLNNDFALNDGALFAQMAKSILDSNFSLPQTVLYNHTDIPFVYPPLSFFLVAVVSAITHTDILQIVRFLPLTFNLACIVLFVILLSQLIPNRRTLFFASVFFPFIPKSYEWLIMGGGVSRSVGFFFTLATLCQVIPLMKKFTFSRFFICSLCLACTGLSHMEWGITVSLSVFLLTLSRGFSRRNFALILALGTVSLLLISPWLIQMLKFHGLAPFLAASRTAEWAPPSDWLRNNLGKFMAAAHALPETMRIPMGILLALGAAQTLKRKNWFAFVWLFGIFFTTPRHGPTAATMPMAMLVATGVSESLLPSLLAVGRWIQRRLQLGVFANKEHVIAAFRRPIPVVITVIVLGIAATPMVSAKTLYPKHTPLVALTPSEREGMEWLKTHTRPDSRFVVISGSLSWQDDRVAEWFPLLSDRKSLTTVQGLEWVPGESFADGVRKIQDLKHQQALGEKNVFQFVENNYDCFDYIAAFSPTASVKHKEFRESGSYRMTFSNDDVVVFERRSWANCLTQVFRPALAKKTNEQNVFRVPLLKKSTF